MRKVVIVSACRTAIGKMGGSLSKISAVDLGALVIKESVRRAGIAPDLVDHVNLGCVIQAGLGQNVARQSSVKAGLPVETTAVTVNAVCGSGLNCVNMSADMIMSGNADIVIAGGTENMSKGPYIIPDARYGYRMNNGTLLDAMVNDALWDAFNNYHMGVTAENICCNTLAQKKYGYSPITREQLDVFSALSQQKACAAQASGSFKEEIVGVPIHDKKKGDWIFDIDESPRSGTTPESLSTLKPAFLPNGIVTAGNSSGINDGAAAVVLMSEEKAIALGVKPLAEYIGGSLGGVEPEVMGLGPIVAVRKVMKKTGYSVEDMDLIEANEAFAAQSIAVAESLHFNANKLNVNGGAIALGHPVGASGCRILVTLLYALKKANARLGLATLCIGGGMGCAVIVKRS